MKRFIQLLLAASLILGFAACDNGGDTGKYQSVSITPTANVIAVNKDTEVQNSITFVLTSTHDGIWNVYAEEDSTEALPAVSAVFAAPNLTLSTTEIDLAVGPYYVSVTETGKTESARLALTVKKPLSSAPAASNATAVKSDIIQKSVVIALTSTVTGTWKVYAAASGGTALTTVSASFTAPNLTLEAEGTDLAENVYYVSVTETDKEESTRLAITVSNPTNRSVSGTVKDFVTQTTMVDGVLVSIDGANLLAPITTTTNASGEFTLANVPYGTNYTVTASKTGYSNFDIFSFTVPALPASLNSVEILLPDEKTRRMGQSVAAASLPER